MKKTIVISILILLCLAVLIFIYWWQRGDALFVQPSSNFQEQKDALLEQTNVQPNSRAEAQIQETIRNFMADPDLILQYITTQKSPSNFTVGKFMPVQENSPGIESAWRIDTPKEWERPVYVFQQTKYINEQCVVYEYEIDARNSQLVEVHVSYPKSTWELSLDERVDKCSSYGSLYTPLKTEAQIETIAMDYLSRIVPNFDQIQSRFVYKPSMENPVNIAAAHEWIWQDTNYQLPEGLSGDVYNYPIIRVIISSGGKLIHYFNSVGLFEN